MNYSLTHRQAVRKFGGVKKMRAEFATIVKKHPEVKVFVSHQYNEEEPEDRTQDWTNILFFYDPSTEKGRAAFNKVKDKIAKSLYAKGLDFEYECNGDADGEIIMSYRVVGLGEYVDLFGQSVNGIEARVS